MAYFTYVATDANGAKVKGKEYAEDNVELMSKLREKNLFVSEYTEIQAQQTVAYQFKVAELAFICRQLASMLRAGISLVKSLHILYSQEEKKKPKAVLLEIYEDVQKGRSFSEAIQARPGVFPNLFVSMVAAGEASGNLDGIMQRVADHYLAQNKTNNKVKNAMTYPLVLLVLLVAMFFGMMIFILPMFRELVTGSDIPPLSAALFAVGDFMQEYWWAIIIAIVVIFFTVRILLKMPKVRLKWDELLTKMPKIGPLMCTIYTSRFARTMSNLFASGLQMVDCIEKSVDTLGNSYIRDVFREHVVEDVKQGEALSTAVAKTGIFPGIFTSIIMVGEESGALDEILSKSADYYEDEADTALQRLVGLMEPVMIIFMGVMVGTILAGIFPILYGGMANVGNT